MYTFSWGNPLGWCSNVKHWCYCIRYFWKKLHVLNLVEDIICLDKAASSLKLFSNLFFELPIYLLWNFSFIKFSIFVNGLTTRNCFRVLLENNSLIYKFRIFSWEGMFNFNGLIDTPIREYFKFLPAIFFFTFSNTNEVLYLFDLVECQPYSASFSLVMILSV